MIIIFIVKKGVYMRSIFLPMLLGIFSFTVIAGCQTDDKKQENPPAVTEQKNNDQVDDHVIKVRNYQNGGVQSETEYVNNVRHGMHKIYDEEGNLASEVRFENNKMVGALKAYYPNGTLKVISYYSEGQPHGDFIAYFPDGKIWRKQQYEMGVLKSTKEYDTEGKLVFEDTF
jgi:antitoxin component YwqK of YwqJK toxin-antitoxin module